MRISEIIDGHNNLSKDQIALRGASREKQRRDLIQFIYGDREREREQLELQKLRAEIRALMAQAALHQAEAFQK